MALDQTNYNVHILQLNNEFDIRRELSNIKTDKKVHDLLIQKMVYLYVKLEQVDTRAANLLKKHMHSIGGEAVISKDAYSFTERTTDVILSASKENLALLAKRIENLPYGLSAISKQLMKSLSSEGGLLKIGDKVLDFKHNTYIMGSIKLFKNEFTFSTSSINQEIIFKNIESLQKAGVKLVELVEAKEETIYDKAEEEKKISILLNLIKNIKTQFPELILALRTSSYLIAKECIESGVDVLNIGLPLKFYEQILHFCARYKTPICILHGSVKEKGVKSLSSISDVIREIQSNVAFVNGLGITRDRIIVEPGIGLRRKSGDNLLILRQLSSLQYLNIPILVSLSRKSFIDDFVKDKIKKSIISSIVAHTMAIINGANIIRVANVDQAVIITNIIEIIKNTYSE